LSLLSISLRENLESQRACLERFAQLKINQCFKNRVTKKSRGLKTRVLVLKKWLQSNDEIQNLKNSYTFFCWTQRMNENYFYISKLSDKVLMNGFIESALAIEIIPSFVKCWLCFKENLKSLKNWKLEMIRIKDLIPLSVISCGL